MFLYFWPQVFDFCKSIAFLQSVVTICCVVSLVLLLQIATSPVHAWPVHSFDEPGVPAEEVHEHLDVDPDVIGPVDSPLKHLEEVQGDKKYVEFINDLYKGDKSKTPLVFAHSS